MKRQVNVVATNRIVTPEGTTRLSLLLILNVRAGVSRHFSPSTKKKSFNAGASVNTRRHPQNNIC
jgi:hypothetical protein